MPSSHRELFPAADENKVLEALERFQREIQKARWTREQATAEFDRFIEGLQVGPEPKLDLTPDAAPVPEAAPRPPAGRALPRHSPALPPERPGMWTTPQPPRAPEAEADGERIGATTSTAAVPSRVPSRRAIAGVTFAALAIAAVAAITFWRGGAPSSPSAPESTDRAAAPAPVPPPPARAAKPSSSTGSAAAAPATVHAATLTTTRPVWVRVTIDGRRLFERELPAGATVPLDGRQGLLIRAGDAGAVRITFADGRTETLGAAGRVVTRRFTLR